MKPLHFSQQGKRPYQEDALTLHPDIDLYMVCDGVGGSARGDMASQTVLQVIGNKLRAANSQGQVEQYLPEQVEALIQQAIIDAQQRLHELALQDDRLEGMATTLTLAWRVSSCWYLAHIGDSRIYYLSPSGYWRTHDHSLVQDLFDKGYLSSEAEMEAHPQANRINRAMQAVSADRYVQADISRLDDYRSGDMLFLCSDGVLEPFGNAGLLNELSHTDRSVADRFATIEDRCRQESKDNNSAILLQLGDSPLAGYGRYSLPLAAIPAPPAAAIELNDEPDSTPLDEVYLPPETAQEPTFEPMETVDDYDAPAPANRWLPLSLGLLVAALLLIWRPWQSSQHPSEAQRSNPTTTPANSQGNPTRSRATIRETPDRRRGDVQDQQMIAIDSGSQRLNEGGSQAAGTPLEDMDPGAGIAPAANSQLPGQAGQQATAPSTDALPGPHPQQNIRPGGEGFDIAENVPGQYFYFLQQDGTPAFNAQMTFRSVRPFSNGRAAVQLLKPPHKWTYIDKQGEFVFRNRLFDQAYDYKDTGLARVEIDGRSFHIDQAGQEVKR